MSLISMLATKRKPPLPLLIHQKPQTSLNSHQAQNFQHKLSHVSYVLNHMRSYSKTYKSSKVCSEKILKKKTVSGGELLLKNAPLRRSFMYFRISPDKYFLPTLAGCFWCFLLLYKLNMIGSYPNERVCLSKISFKIRADLRLWIQSNKLSKLARFPCCKWVRSYSWTWARDESSNLIINPAIFLSGLEEVDFAVASVAVKKYLHQTSKRGAYKVYIEKDRYSIGKYASCHGVAISVRAWKKSNPNLKHSKALCVNLKNLTNLNSKKQAARMHHPKRTLGNKMRWRPTLLAQKLNTLVQKFVRATRYKDGVVNTQAALATAKAIVKRYPFLKREMSSWVQLG